MPPRPTPKPYPGARISTTTTWGRRLTRGPWHVLNGGHAGFKRTGCGKTLTGELERTTATADGPERDPDRLGSHVCRACIAWAHESKTVGRSA